jgi:hypothetical protein
LRFVVDGLIVNSESISVGGIGRNGLVDGRLGIGMLAGEVIGRICSNDDSVIGARESVCPRHDANSEDREKGDPLPSNKGFATRGASSNPILLSVLKVGLAPLNGDADSG